MSRICYFSRFKGGFLPPKKISKVEEYEAQFQPIVNYLVAGLSNQGLPCSTPEWVDYEFLFDCSVLNRTYTIYVGFDYVGQEWFDVGYSPQIGFLKRLLGHSEEKEMHQLSKSIDHALKQNPNMIIRWYKEYESNPDKRYLSTFIFD